MRYRKVGTNEVVEFPEPLVAFDVSTSWERLDDEAPPVELDSLKRSDLDAMATELGVESPDQLPNKGAVIEAIKAAEKAAGERPAE